MDKSADVQYLREVRKQHLHKPHHLIDLQNHPGMMWLTEKANWIVYDPLAFPMTWVNAEIAVVSWTLVEYQDNYCSASHGLPNIVLSDHHAYLPRHCKGSVSGTSSISGNFWLFFRNACFLIHSNLPLSLSFGAAEKLPEIGKVHHIWLLWALSNNCNRRRTSWVWRLVIYTNTSLWCW